MFLSRRPKRVGTPVITAGTVPPVVRPEDRRIDWQRIGDDITRGVDWGLGIGRRLGITPQPAPAPQPISVPVPTPPSFDISKFILPAGLIVGTFVLITALKKVK